MEDPSSRERSGKARARRSLNQKNENEEELEEEKEKWTPILAYSVRTFTTPTRREDETA